MKLVACLPERLLALFGGKFFFSEDCTFDAPFLRRLSMATEKIEAEILEDTFTFALSAKATVLLLPAMFSTILIDTEKNRQNEILLSTLFPSITRRKHKDDDHHQGEARLQAFQLS